MAGACGPTAQRAGNARPGSWRAIAWHLRVGGPWRALPPGGPPWRTVYGWFRKWLEQGLFDRLRAMWPAAAAARWAAGPSLA